MNIHISGDISPLIFSLGAFLYGLVACFFPFTVARLLVLWPKFVASKIFRDNAIPSKAKEAMALINDPEAYQEQFGYQLLIIRATGGFILLLFCCMILWIFAKS
jgi:hypothetical protein